MMQFDFDQIIKIIYQARIFCKLKLEAFMQVFQ